jgi:cysteine desulfurase
VLLAMGIDPQLAHGSLRLTIGQETTSADVERTVEVATSVVRRMRAASDATPRAVTTA